MLELSEMFSQPLSNLGYEVQEERRLGFKPLHELLFVSNGARHRKISQSTAMSDALDRKTTAQICADRPICPAVSQVLQALCDNQFNVDKTCLALNALRKQALDSKVFPDDLAPALPLICQRMEQYIDNVLVQKHSILAIASLGDRKDLRRQIAESGALAQLFLVWGAFQNDEDLSKEVLATLRTLTSLEANRSFACNAGAVLSTVSAMKQFTKRVSIQSQGISLLTSLVFGSDADKLDVCTNGGVAVTVQSLKTFFSHEHASLQAKGCIFFRNISADHSAGATCIVKEGGVACIIDAIEKFQSSREVLDHGIAALVNLIRAPSKCLQAEPVLFKNVVKTISNLLFRTRSRSDRYGKVQERSLGLLGTAAKDDPHAQDVIGRVGAIPNIIAVMKLQFHPKLPPPASTPYLIVCRAVALLRLLAFHERNRNDIATLDGGVKCLIDSVLTLKGEAAQIEQALLAIGNSLFDSRPGKESFNRNNGVVALLSVMKEHPHVTGVQEACCLSLRSVCSRSPDNAGTAIKLGGIPLCLHVLRSFRGNCVLQEQGISCLIVLFQNSTRGESQTEVLETVRQSVQLFPFSVTLRAQEELLLKFVNRDDAGTKPKDQHRKLRFVPQKKKALQSKFKDDTS